MHQTDTVSLSSVTFSYQGKPIIDDFNLSIQKGTVVAIMGGSGVGKTTLLRLISGLKKPAKGKVSVMGSDLTKISKSLAGIADINDLGRISSGFYISQGVSCM